MKRVVLGMSGGTDSSVAAMLLREQGFDVVGVTLRLWSDQDLNPPAQEPEYLNHAQHLAQQLGIEHHIIDVKSKFYSEIVQYFISEYLQGRTPNPCARCNVVLKWKLLLDEANRLNCEFIATGHYANIEKIEGRFYVIKGFDPDKEQSFFLWGLGQDILSRAILPLGNRTKTEVKRYAESRGFTSVSKRKESIGVCFIHDGKYRPFLKQVLGQQGRLPGKGNFTDAAGNMLGEHQGYLFYTVGQRRGLGLEPDEPWYVTHINAETNIVELGKRNDLYQHQMLVRNYHLVNPADFNQPVVTRIRYRKQSAWSCVEIIDNQTLKVTFAEPEWSIAPGQAAAFYSDDRLLGGGFIV